MIFYHVSKSKLKMNKYSDLKILVVDDDPDQLAITKRLLNEQEYEITTVINGQVCLQAIRQKKPDLLLLDVILPDTSGIEICKAIRRDPAGMNRFTYKQN